MIFARFQDLLEQTMGLHAASIGASAIERAVRERLRAHKIEDAETYWKQLLASSDELQALIEGVVVPETWFFRGSESFAAMVRILLEEWLPAHPSGPARLLSLPCSTGEEPYTMAMALIDAGLPPHRFRIDAIDISSRALTHGQRGIYRDNSFREKDVSFRSRHFKKFEQGWLTGDHVREAVHFMQGNLLDGEFLRDAEAYDIVFCRNLLIYFDADTQGRAIGVLKRLLAPKGVLFVGHSEAGLMLDHQLASAKIPMAFAFCKETTPQGCAKKPVPVPMAVSPKLTVPAKAQPQVRRAITFKPENPPPNLDELRSIADNGQLAKAAQGCEAYIRAHGPSPDALFLLGLISDAGGDLQAAAAHYRKALYLDPDHGETLGHLALLLQKQGDVAGAKVLDARIRRLVERKAG